MGVYKHFKGEALTGDIWVTSRYQPSPRTAADLDCPWVAGLASEVQWILFYLVDPLV